MPDHIIELYREMYRQARRVVVDGRHTEEISVDTGLAQVAVDSPILYDIFINDLADELYRAATAWWWVVSAFHC